MAGKPGNYPSGNNQWQDNQQVEWGQNRYSQPSTMSQQVHSGSLIRTPREHLTQSTTQYPQANEFRQPKVANRMLKFENAGYGVMSDKLLLTVNMGNTQGHGAQDDPCHRDRV
jgi:hypothetical protein